MSNPRCCICGKECENKYGNNPFPVSPGLKDRCCDSCNSIYVIPARLFRLQEARLKMQKDNKGDNNNDDNNI